MGPILLGFWLFPIGPNFWILVWDRKKFGFPEPWCVYMYVYLYTYVYVGLYMYVYVYLCVFMYMCVSR